MNSRRFIEALRAVEERGDVEEMASLYGDQAELMNPRLNEPMRGPDGARQFWRTYLEAFATVHSDFGAIIEADKHAALEWTSSGTLRAGDKPFRYSGVSIVEWSGAGDGGITRFVTYFDTAALTVGAARGAMSTSAGGHTGGQ